MLSFFNFISSKKKLIDTGFLKGATDWHSHILPGVDDGIQNMRDSLDVLGYYEQIGISEVWLTPHIMEDMPNTPDELRARYQELQDAYQGPIQLNLAAENMLDNLFNERLAANNLLPIGPKGDHLLVETSYFQPPIDFWETLKKIQELGYTPILAHPERYRYMNESDYERLVSEKIKLQMNIVSLAGGYGKPAQIKAQMLLSQGHYSFYGSDLHFLPHFRQAIYAKVIRKEQISSLLGIKNKIE